MLLNYCQLWQWTDGYNTVTMITAGMCIILTSDGGYTDTAEVPQFATSATEHCQNYCKWLFVVHESFVSLWAVLTSPDSLCCWKDAEGRKVLSKLLWDKRFVLFWGVFSDGEVSGIRGRGKRGGILLLLPQPPQHCIEQVEILRWFGVIHTLNDSSSSGNTERMENACKDDCYNFQHLGPKS